MLRTDTRRAAASDRRTLDDSTLTEKRCGEFRQRRGYRLERPDRMPHTSVTSSDGFRDG